MDGVLGGYAEVHDQDTKTSHEMLHSFREQMSGFDRAVDLGAGIGRVAKNTLLPHFKEVDLVEPSKTQIQRARDEVP